MIAAAASLCLLVYLFSLAIHRLYFSPLAKFPGPKLAALTKWYEAYYEIVKKGRFYVKIDEMHDRYGPIVRITPFELHIKDSNFASTLYLQYPKAHKYEWMSGRFGNDTSIFTTADPGVHRVRKGALQPMFSRKAILDQKPIIYDKVELFCQGVERCYENGSVLTISNGYSALAGDIIMQYSFGFSYDHLKSHGFKENFHDAFMAVCEFSHVATQFPFVHPLLNSLPDDLNRKMNPPLGKLLQLQKDLRRIMAEIRKDQEKGLPYPDHKTIFYTVLDSDIPDSEKTNLRLAEEAQTVIAAGLETTGWSLSNATFYILSDAEIYSKLRSELWQAIPDLRAAGAFEFEKLETLPYLRGCIREAIRMSHNVSARNPRLIGEPVAYGEWIIPAWTPTSMTVMDMHYDESIFPEANIFKPERWTDGASLEKYFIGFGKGPRSCLGINLAYMELFVTLATVFRRFSLELFETDTSDVELAHDFFLPSPKLGSKGIRVKVLGLEK